MQTPVVTPGPPNGGSRIDYGHLLGEALRLTRRYRFLWLFGLFASGSSCSLNAVLQPVNVPSGVAGAPDLARLAAALLLAWGVPVWVAAVLGALLLVVVSLALHFVAQGAMICAVLRVSTGGAGSAAADWAAGRRRVGRYAGLWLAGAAALAGLAVATVAVSWLLVVLTRGNAPLALAAGVVAPALISAAGLPFTVGLSLVLIYAARAIAIDDLTARQAIRRGVALLRVHLGASLVLWLISAGITAAMAVATVVALAVPVTLGGALLAVAGAAWGSTAPTIAAGAVAGLIVAGVAWGLWAVMNTYMAGYWTLGYLALTGRSAPVVPLPVAAAPAAGVAPPVAVPTPAVDGAPAGAAVSNLAHRPSRRSGGPAPASLRHCWSWPPRPCPLPAPRRRTCRVMRRSRGSPQQVSR
ncbi:MAG: hypothetical protein HY332_11235 [Chloroflexi bacterium]|nr:hypothetical protein [Chloroflexota bacterium]